MTDHDDGLDRDPVVAKALRDMPVPDHAPGFWEALDRRLVAQERAAPPPPDRRVATSELPAVSVLRPAPAAPPAMRYRFLAVAAALAVLAITAGVVLRGDGGGGPVQQADSDDRAATTTAALGDAAPDPVVPPRSPTVPAAGTPEEAVLEWVRALGRGDEATAAGLLGPTSRRYIESLGTEPESFMLDYEEGYGPWAGAPDLSAATVEIPDVGVVVVLSGTYLGEGSADYQRVDAFPTVRTGPDQWQVEPVALPADVEARLELISPEPGPDGWSGLPPEGPIQVVSRGAATYWFALDDLPAERDEDGRWSPREPMSSRTHQLVVVAVGTDLFTAVAGTFVVEG